MIAILKIKEVGGRIWEVNLLPNSTYAIGRGKENDSVLKDRRVSRKHAEISTAGMQCKIIDGYIENGEIKRSINRVFINGEPRYEKFLEPDDVIIIGETTLEFKNIAVAKPISILSYKPEINTAEAKDETGKQTNERLSDQTGDEPTAVKYDDKPLG
ncbi:MAG TPA: FHA domain-containing protein, partial [Pyrinomonadaceae bacterium]